MTESGLTENKIMNAGEDVLRRFGPEKVNLSDVAKQLSVTHAAIYKYFRNKNSLWDAIAERWLSRVSKPLNQIMEASYSSETEKLKQWLFSLADSKRKSALEDPEMFHLYAQTAERSGDVLVHHLEFLMSQLEEICREGLLSGEFQGSDAKNVSRAIFSAFSEFHNPAFSAQWGRKSYAEDFNHLWQLIRAGLHEK